MAYLAVPVLAAAMPARRKLFRIQTRVQFGRFAHRGPAHVVRLCQVVAVARCGGLRSGMTFVGVCAKRRRTTSISCSMPVNTVASSRRALPGCNRNNSSTLLFAQECCVRSKMLACVCSAAARYRKHVVKGTRDACSGAMLPMSRMIVLNPPPCRSRSVVRSACSIRGQGKVAVLRRSTAVFCVLGSKVSFSGLSLRCGSAQRGAKASGFSKLLTAPESPLISLRGCDPNPPPCRPFLVGGGIMYFSGREKVHFADGLAWDAVCAPQRTQRIREISTPTAAADSGSKVSDTSIQAHTFSARVM
jgi:hypothetical protein